MSESPTLVRFVNDRKSSSNHVRCACGRQGRRERSRPQHLDGHERVGEGPGHDRERGGRGPELVGRHEPVVEDVPDERRARVEVEGRVEDRGQEDHGTVRRIHDLPDRQADQGQTQHDGDPPERGRRANRSNRQEEDRQTDGGERGPPEGRPFHERKQDDAAELRDEQHRRRLIPESRKPAHAGCVTEGGLPPGSSNLTIRATSAGENSSVASPTESSVRLIPGVSVAAVPPKAQTRSRLAIRRMPASAIAGVVRRWRWSIDVWGGSGTTSTPSIVASSAAIARACDGVLGHPREAESKASQARSRVRPELEEGPAVAMAPGARLPDEVLVAEEHAAR